MAYFCAARTQEQRFLSLGLAYVRAKPNQLMFISVRGKCVYVVVRFSKNVFVYLSWMVYG